MANIFNYYGDSSCNSITLQPLVETIPSSLVSQSRKPVLLLNSSSNHNETSSLLVKRRQNTEFGDLLAKKIKTISTNASESFSYQSSPTIDRSSDFVMTETRMVFEDSYQQVQNALEMLQQKLLIEQELAAQSSVKKQQVQENLSIPPFLSIIEPLLVKEKKQNGKNSRMMEEELDVIYGDVEFPFLNDAPFQSSNLSQVRSKNIRSSKTKESSYLSQLPSRLASLIDDDEESEGSFITDLRDSLTATRTATQRSESDFGVATKKNSRIAEERMKEHKKAIARTVESTMKEEKLPKKNEGKNKQQEENIYSLPVSQGKRQKERKLNRWQIAQSDKLSNDGSSSESSSWETNSDGGKKKKLVKVPIGPKYQVDISALPRRDQGRKLKMVWNPTSSNQQVLQIFFESVRNLLNYNVSEEFGIELLNMNGQDINRTLKFVRAHPAQCLDLLPAKCGY